MYDSMRNDFIVELGKTCVDVNLDDIESALLDRMAVTGKTYGDAVQIESIKVTRKK